MFFFLARRRPGSPRVRKKKKEKKVGLRADLWVQAREGETEAVPTDVFLYLTIITLEVMPLPCELREKCDVVFG